MADVQGGRVIVTVEGRDLDLSKVLANAETRLSATAKSAQYFGGVMNELSPVEKKAESAIASFSLSLARNAVSAKDYDVAIQHLGNTLRNDLTPGTVNYNNVAAQLQKTLALQNNEAKSGAPSFLNLSKSASILAGSYLVLSQVVPVVTDAIKAGNELEKTEATFRALSGSQETYVKNLQIAKSQQAQFGGSLKDNIEGLSGFANLSNRTGIELNKLANIARRLAIIDPAQGFKGASIALKEFFSGDTTSLARRFEINKKDLNGLKQLGSDAAKLEGLDEVLTKLGISQELLAAQTETTAVTYDKLAGSAQDAFAMVGQALAQAFEGSAQKWQVFFADFANGMDALNTRTDKLNSLGAGAVTGTKSYEEYAAAVQNYNNQISQQAGILSIFVGKVQEATPLQYAFIQALIAQGDSAEVAYQKLQNLGNASSDVVTQQGLLQRHTTSSAESINKMGVSYLVAASMGSKAQSVAQGYITSVLNQNMSIEEAIKYLDVYIATINAQTQGTQQAATATDAYTNTMTVFTNEVRNNAAAQADDTIASQALSVAQQTLMSIAQGAADGLISASQAAAALESQFNMTTQEAYKLIAALQEISGAKARAELGIAQYDDATQRAILGGRSAVSVQQSTKEADKIIKSYKSYLEATSSAQQNLASAKAELNGIKKGTAEWYDQQTKIARLQQQVDNEAKKGKKTGGGSPKLTTNEKINNSLLKQQDNFNNKFEDAEQEHYDNLEKIVADYNRKFAEQMAENEKTKRRSRSDFYGNLGDMEGIDSGKFAAEYEEAFAQAQKIAQDGKAKLSQEFLDLRQSQIEEMAKLDEEAAKVKSDKNLNKKEKQRRLDYIEGRRKLVADAQAEEQKQLLNGGDALQNEKDKQLADEQSRYTDSVDKISTEAERKANAIVTQAEREKKAVSDANLELANQLKTTQSIADAANTINPSATSTTSQDAAVTPAPTDTAQKVDVSESSPIPIDNTTAMLVQQQSVWLVRDDSVIGSITDMASRLENRLTDVITSVNTAADRITSAVGEVKSAVNGIKTTTIVQAG